MAFLPPLWMQVGTDEIPIEYPLDGDRYAFTSTVFSREGVQDKDGNHLKVTQRSAGANMSVDVASGRCAILGGENVSGVGMYLCTSTSVTNVAIAAPPSGTRVYVVYAQVRDKHSAVGTPPSTSSWIISATYDAGNPSVAPTITDGIPLATVSTTSSTSSITNALITDTRTRLSVGTKALSGPWGTGIDTTHYSPSDPTRPLTWSKDPNGWVTLGGWLIRQTSSFNPTVGTFYEFGAPGAMLLPPEIRPTGIRDIIGLTASGDIHYAIQPDGRLLWRFLYGTTVSGTPGSATWFTFDGLFYRSNVPL